MIRVRLISGLFRNYSIAKANYYYSKVEENIKKWLAKIIQIIKANNITVERRMTVTIAYLRDIAINWYKVDKANIN